MKRIKQVFQSIKDALADFFFVHRDEADLTATLVLDRKAINKELQKHGIA